MECGGGDVTKAVLWILNDDEPIEPWNETLITLIPKVKDPMLMKDFRPISLCNVNYKIVTRVITNRLRPTLENNPRITKCFISGRSITDNIIVGFEMLHWMRNRRSGRTGYAALKLDMSKAYNRVEWGFLQAMMKRLGFKDSWVKKIINCVLPCHILSVLMEKYQNLLF